MPQRLWLLQLMVAFVAAAGIVAWIGEDGGAFALNGQPLPAPQGETHHTGYPMRWSDYHGYSLTLESPPATVASRALAIDHLLFEVLPESQIAGISEFAHLPEFSNVHDHVRRLGLSALSDGEPLAAIAPSLLLVSENTSPDFVRRARAMHAPVFTMRTMFSELQDIVEAMRLIGELTGQQSRAFESIRGFNAAVDDLVRGVPQLAARPRVLGLTSYYHCFGAGSLVEDVVVTLGAINICSEFGLGPSEKVDPEQIVRWNPDWVVIGTGAETGVKRWPSWHRIRQSH